MRTNTSYCQRSRSRLQCTLEDMRRMMDDAASAHELEVAKLKRTKEAEVKALSQVCSARVVEYMQGVCM